VVGTGAYSRMPVMKDVRLEADRHKIDLLIFPTEETLKQAPEDTNAILHVTC
jgi:hypothetical protein